MKTLVIDTTRKELVVALIDYENNKIKAKYDVKNNVLHNETLLSSIDELLKSQKTELKNVDCIAVNAGPGSFTGIRVGISVVKGFGCALKFKCVALNSLELLLANSSLKNGLAMLSAGAENYYVAVVENHKITKQMHLTLEEYAEQFKDFQVCCLSSEKDFFEKIKVTEFVNNTTEHLNYNEYILEKINNNEFCDVNSVTPLYLRLSQAERELIKKEGKC